MLFTFRQALLGAAICLASSIMAQEENLSTTRSEVGLEFTSELQATQEGDYNYVNLLQLNASLSMTGSISLEAGSLSTCMTAEESIGGDLQTFSNLDAGNIPFALSMLDLSWDINENHSLCLGIRNMNEDYFASDVTSFFTNSSCGIYPTISANYSIANYPMTSMGLHYSYTAERWAFQASLYNGQGYNHFTGRDNVFRFCPKSDGVFGLIQVEHINNGSHYFLGNAIYCNDGAGLTPWIYAEQRINDNIALIAGYSHAFGDNVECRDFVCAGAYYERRRCAWGVFADYANFANAHEYAAEITFKYRFTQNIYTQPTLHVISTHQGSSATQLNACLRLGITL